MKKKRVALLISLCIIVITCVFFLFNQSEVSPLGTSLTEKQFEKDLKIIKGENIKINNFYYLSYVNFDNDPKYESRYRNITDSKSKILSISITNKKWFTEGNIPYEIQHAMRVWLYLQERHPPVPIIDVWSYYDIRGIVDQDRIVEISLLEFEELYEEVHNASAELTNEEMIQELTELWLEKNPDYPRWWIK